MEDVLNKLRKGELKTNAVIMDALLQAIDTLKLLLEDLRTGKIAELIWRSSRTS